ncbi:MAG: 16S rRNA (guanine(966)-N(2))-methyltransferase RsmD [Ruminococcaceae bacterium]|nr:16S rRNA (guanine(966)-N(2))-methyltransferase RsmD [Oscillospiraceae bacterium]
MRIITGTARGKRLITVPGSDVVRPTPERVKEGLFSAIQFDIEGRRILDLFAGSGQLGLEALSRGADSATFVDSSDASINVLKQNVKNTGFDNNSRIVKSDFASFCATSNDTFDIAFVDPPYGAGLFEQAIEKCIPLMSDYGMIFCEHPTDIKLPEIIGSYKLSRSYRYGKVAVELYRKG